MEIDQEYLIEIIKRNDKILTFSRNDREVSKYHLFILGIIILVLLLTYLLVQIGFYFKL